MNYKILILGVILAVAVVGVVLISTSGNEEDNYTLGDLPETRLMILGNAYMDDYLDQKDVNYLSDLISGVEGPTENDLCDANGDGVIDEADVEQIKDMIAKKAKKIWYVDVDKEVRSINYPLTNMLPVYIDYAEILFVLGQKDRIVGGDDTVVVSNFTQFELNVPTVGSRYLPNLEAILTIAEEHKNLTIFTGTRQWYDGDLESKIESYGIQVIRLPGWENGLADTGVRTVGFLMDQNDRAEKYLKWHDGIMDKIEDRVKDIPENERRKVFLDYNGNSRGPTSGYYENIIFAGGINLCDHLGDGTKYNNPWDAEWVLLWNPEIFMSCVTSTYVGTQETLDNRYNDLREKLVRYTGDICVFGYEIANGPSYVVSLIIYASLFYPDLFEDLDPIAEFQYYLDNIVERDADASSMAIIRYETR